MIANTVENSRHLTERKAGYTKNRTVPNGRGWVGDIFAGAALVAGTVALFTLAPEASALAIGVTVVGFELSVAAASFQWGCDATGGCSWW